MSYKCNYCGRGKVSGHMVSPAKNRLRRLFKPNLQKLKVLKNGVSIRVKFCTGCIKRLKKDGHMGVYTFLKYTPAVVKTEPVRIEKAVKPKEKVKTKVVKEVKVKEKKTKEKESPKAAPLDIASIVGKKS